MNRRLLLYAFCLVWGVFLIYTVVRSHRLTANSMFQQLRSESLKNVQNVSVVKEFEEATITKSSAQQVKQIKTDKARQVENKNVDDHLYEGQPSTCVKKRRNICFLKVHKCGSSTMANVLQRFTLKHNLNGIYPNKKVTQQSFWILNRIREDYSNQILPIPKGEHYNTLFVHTVHDKKRFSRLFPKDVYYLAIVRDPVERFVSYSFYYRVVDKIKKMYPNDKSPYIFSKALHSRPLTFHAHRYGALYDFGYPTMKPFNENEVRKYVKMIDKDYDFVMIMEYFDESLIYLRRQLCWDLSDMLYLKRNVNSRKKDFGLTPNDRKLIRELQPDEVILYDYFYEKFWNMLKKQPMNFFHEVSTFKQILKEVADFCKYRDKSKREEILIARTQWNPPFRIKSEDCQQMEWLESYAIQFLGNKLREKYKKSLKKNE